MQQFRFRFIRWIIKRYLAQLLLQEVLGPLKTLYFAHIANLFCLLFSERERITSLNRNNWLAFVLKTNCVLNYTLQHKLSWVQDSLYGSERVVIA